MRIDGLAIVIFFATPALGIDWFDESAKGAIKEAPLCRGNLCIENMPDQQEEIIGTIY